VVTARDSAARRQAAADQAEIRDAAAATAAKTARHEFPAPARLDPAAAGVWEETIAAHHEPAKIAGPDLEAYAGQVALQRDLRERIAREGSIVEDERGRPMAHPAIALERAAQAEIRAWGDRFRGRAPRPDRRPR
jgi:phage terminase small subunit